MRSTHVDRLKWLAKGIYDLADDIDSENKPEVVSIGCGCDFEEGTEISWAKQRISHLEKIIIQKDGDICLKDVLINQLNEQIIQLHNSTNTHEIIPAIVKTEVAEMNFPENIMDEETTDLPPQFNIVTGEAMSCVANLPGFSGNIVAHSSFAPSISSESHSTIIDFKTLPGKRVYTTAENSTCKICGYRSSKPCKLKIHMRKHTGEKPYKCPGCEKRFACMSSLNIHKVLHTGTRPFQCDYCDQTFRQRSTLRFHMMTHTGVKPHKCPSCDASFVRRMHLDRHLKSKHNTNSQQLNSNEIWQDLQFDGDVVQ